VAEKESWRKELHRPIYHLHKWWAKRLGSVFRAILLGSVLTDKQNLLVEFYKKQSFKDLRIFDPFMGSGTTVGEAHKLGFTVFGRDINPVAAESVRVGLGPMDKSLLFNEFNSLEKKIGKSIKSYYRSKDSNGDNCDILYFFWVMIISCKSCNKALSLFPSYIISQNAYPNKNPRIEVYCPNCEGIFSANYNHEVTSCKHCNHSFNPRNGNLKKSFIDCDLCLSKNSISENNKLSTEPPKYRLFAKLILNKRKEKEYLKVTPEDIENYSSCEQELNNYIQDGKIRLPDLSLENGYNTKQAINYGFNNWRNFFNSRQLLILGKLLSEIEVIPDKNNRELFLLFFSTILEFNNLFTSYKGEGTGAVRHMFSNHVLKPEKTPIEANIWGTDKSSGSFTNLFKSKIDRILKYRKEPVELHFNKNNNRRIVASEPFSGKVCAWPENSSIEKGSIYLSCGDSAQTLLPEKSIDLIVTDPPFFDNVHYSELADFFYSWQKLSPRGFINDKQLSTRNINEVQDIEALEFSNKLSKVFIECNRVLTDEGIFIFTYHHSREEGWIPVIEAILEAGFYVINAHPIKSEMSNASPKSQAKEPIQFDIIIVLRKQITIEKNVTENKNDIIKYSVEKISRLEKEGFKLSENDKKVILYGQILSCIRSKKDIQQIPDFYNWGMRYIVETQKENKVKVQKLQSEFQFGD